MDIFVVSLSFTRCKVFSASCNSCFCLDRIATWQPCSTIFLARANPIPLEPPVIRADFPSNKDFWELFIVINVHNWRKNRRSNRRIRLNWFLKPILARESDRQKAYALFHWIRIFYTQLRRQHLSLYGGLQILSRNYCIDIRRWACQSLFFFDFNPFRQARRSHLFWKTRW